MRILLLVDCYLPSTKSSAKLVHDLNDSLQRVTGIDRTVRFSKKLVEKCYVLAGVHATVSSTVYGGHAPSGSRRAVAATPTARDA